MRQFLSKSLAGGLSAGIVLLWWPLLFQDDTLASWLVRGVAWTICSELLLLALGPLESALWETRRGERVSRRAREAGSRLRSGSPRRTLARLAVIAVAALAIPAALLATGTHEREPAKAERRPVKVVEVTRVVRPVTVRRVNRVVVTGPAPVSAPTPPTSKAPVRSRQRRPAPRLRQVDPPPAKQPVPRAEAPAQAPAEPQDCGNCEEESPPASGSSI